MNEIALHYPERVSALVGDGYDLTQEDEFRQAGADLVAIGRMVVMALGELIEYKRQLENIGEGGVNQICKDYAAAWGTNRSTLIRAWVLVTKYAEVDRPEDMSDTLAYELKAGAVDAEDLERGYDIALRDGWTVADARLAKRLREAGLVTPPDWVVPHCYVDGDGLWVQVSDGTRRRVMVRVQDEGRDHLIDIGLAVIRWRL